MRLLASKLRSREIVAAAVGVLIALSISAINISWYSRAATGWVHTGFLQSDQNTYTAIVREIFERGNGFAYASPYEIRDTTPPIYFQLPFFLLGWFWRLTRLLPRAR
jgi:hypothetical protein